MQDINLLQNKLKDKTDQFDKNNRLIMVILSLLLVAVLVATGAFYMLTSNAEESKLALDQENVSIQNRLDQMESQMVLAKGFQAQTQNITTLLNSHVVWTNFMNELASKTYKVSRYMSMGLETTGNIHVEGIAPTYVEIGKLLLAFETSKELKSVKLLSTSPSTDEQAGIAYSLELVVDQQALINQN